MFLVFSVFLVIIVQSLLSQFKRIYRVYKEIIPAMHSIICKHSLKTCYFTAGVFDVFSVFGVFGVFVNFRIFLSQPFRYLLRLAVKQSNACVNRHFSGILQ